MDESNLEDTQGTQRRLRTRKAEGNNPYAGGTVPSKTLGGKARARQVEELVRAKKFANEMRIQEKNVDRPAERPSPSTDRWLPRAMNAVFAAVGRAFGK